jgi:3-isopropylmalate/(R)-2-methylmalate dehydratase small subunit
VVDDASVERLLATMDNQCQLASVDLAQQTFQMAGTSVAFDIKPHWKQKLLNGWDDIALTLSLQGAIDEFQRLRATRVPWLFP